MASKNQKAQQDKYGFMDTKGTGNKASKLQKALPTV